MPGHFLIGRLIESLLDLPSSSYLTFTSMALVPEFSQAFLGVMEVRLSDLSNIYQMAQIH